MNPCCYYPCQNSGVCVRFGLDRYQCDCTRTGFYGDNCTVRKYSQICIFDINLHINALVWVHLKVTSTGGPKCPPSGLINLRSISVSSCATLTWLLGLKLHTNPKLVHSNGPLLASAPTESVHSNENISNSAETPNFSSLHLHFYCLSVFQLVVM